jgi:hypothetical protein
VYEKLDRLLVLPEVDEVDALGEDEAEPLLELVDVPAAVLSLVTRYISPDASDVLLVRWSTGSPASVKLTSDNL